MFTFHWPILALFLVVPFLMIRFSRPKSAGNTPELPGIRFPQLARLRNSFGAYQAQKSLHSKWHALALFVIWAFCVFALMRPETVNQLSEIKNEGHDLIMAVDLSGSMQSLDFSEGNTRVSLSGCSKESGSGFR